MIRLYGKTKFDDVFDFKIIVYSPMYDRIYVLVVNSSGKKTNLKSPKHQAQSKCGQSSTWQT